MKKQLFLILLFLVGQRADGLAQSWFELGTGSNVLKANGSVGCLCTDDSDNVYAAGGFWDSTSFSVGRCYVAKWNAATHQWSELGTGSNRLGANDGILSICLDKHGNLYAAGAFTDSTLGAHLPFGHFYVAKWNGSTWSQLGTGTHALNADGSINSICADSSGNIYAAGNFRNMYGNNYVAKWNGTDWTDLGNLNANLFIYSICLDDSNNVYAAGHFTDAAGRTYVAKFSKAAGVWTELDTGFGTSADEVIINSIFSDTPGHVVAGLSFTPGTSGIVIGNVFKWNGSAWSQLGNLNGNSFINTVCKGDSGYVYVGGRFTNAANRQYLARWDPLTNNWSELGSGTLGLDSNSGIGYLCTDRHYNLYAAGGFTDTISTTYNYQYVAEYGKSTLSVQPLAKRNFDISIYPNPATAEIDIEIRSQMSYNNISYSLYDYAGRVCRKGTFNISTNNQSVIDISGLEQGSYVLSINGEAFNLVVTR